MDEQQRAAILNEAQRKIMQTEQLEEKRRRRVIKMQRMSKYNDLMTQSDKDFITRIQVSQLVTEDPFVEDYYAQVYSAHFRQNGGEERILKLGSGGVGLGMPGTRAGRRENAMQRMQQQVERIVKHAQQRDKGKATNALHYLQGALGKTAGRSYKAAPRQLLQVDNAGNGSSSPKKTAGHISKEDAEDPAKNPAVLNAFNEQTTEQLAPLKPLDRHQLLIYIENLITKFLDVELLRRRINADGAQELVEEVENLADRIYKDLHIVVPLEASEPHPFIALLGPAKGKRMFPRFPATFDSGQLTNVITLLLATFYQLDVVQNAALLDTLEDSPQKAEVKRQTQVFQECVIQTIGRILATAPLGMVAGLLRVLVSRNVTTSKLRAHLILQASGLNQPDGPTPDEVQARSR
ncbi:hypothetical protein AURDEDRAFT_123069 [Auricularia subglabra TFB-10046 SS5]|nr:hypothetical protein AURDEDRAFT_123069 [Auricularia subglabra TFB-10046 SS5]